MELTKETTKRIAQLIILTGLVLLGIIYIKNIYAFILSFWRIIYPFVIGFFIAFILNIITNKLECTILKDIKKGKRFISFILTIIILLSLMILVGFIIGPTIVSSFTQLTKQIPGAYDSIINLLKDNQNIFGGVFKDNINDLIKMEIDLSSISTNVIDNWPSIFNSGYSFISNTLSGLYSFFIGLVFSIYLLLNKETLLKQLSIVSNTLIGEKKTTYIQAILELSGNTFSNFITCQCLEACILGAMFFITMTIFQMPYAMLVAIVIAITALIPVFGAFIGCFIGVVLIGISNPVQALWFIVLFLVLQQIEGNMIYPHVVGNSVGLPSIWVFVSVIIGGNLMGIMGMFIFIPITSIIYTLFKAYIKKQRLSN